MFRECICLIFLANVMTSFSQSDQPSAPLTPPPTTAATPPSDPNNCDLSISAPLGFVVKIWDMMHKNTAAHGSLISISAVITSGTNFRDNEGDNFTSYEIVGQNIWNPQKWDNPCKQVRQINRTILYDRCCDADTYKFYNFRILVVGTPFKVGSSFTVDNRVFPLEPLLRIPQNPAMALLSVEQYNSGKAVNCTLPIFAGLDKPEPVLFPMEKLMTKVLNYNESCIKMICEKDVFRDGSARECEASYMSRKYGTMMCVEFEDQSMKSQLPEAVRKATDFYAGAPLLCEGVALGIVTEVFVRDDQRPFFLIVTFLRVYEWVLRHQAFLSNNGTNAQQVFIEEWDMLPRYKSSEPTPAYFVEPGLVTKRKPRSFSPGNHEFSLVLALLPAIHVSM